MCTSLAYKGPEVDGPDLVTHANKHLFPKSLRNLAHSMSDKAFFYHLLTNQSPIDGYHNSDVLHADTRKNWRHCSCSMSVKWNIRRIPCQKSRQKDLPTAFLVSLILRAGQRRGVFSDCKSSSCFKWAGVKKSTLLCLGDLTVLDQGEQQLHSSSGGLCSRKKKQHRPVVAWYFSLISCPLISDISRCLEHLVTKCPFSILEM